MSYLPSPFTGFYSRMDNTVVSGSQLLSHLTGDDVRDLEFEANIRNPAPITPVLGNSTTPSTATLTMTPQQLIQAAISTAPVIWKSGTTGATGYISLGADTASQALSYIQMLNLNTVNDKRILRFTLGSSLATADTVAIGNSSNTGAYIIPRNSGSAGTNTGSTLLFSQLIAVGSAQSGQVGSERIVLVSPTGAPPSVVYFDVLGSSQ